MTDNNRPSQPNQEAPKPGPNGNDNPTKPLGGPHNAPVKTPDPGRPPGTEKV